MARDNRYSFLFFTWMATLTALSLLPSDSMDIRVPPVPHLDKWAHFIFYAVAMTLGTLFLRERFRKGSRAGTALMTMGGALLVYGMVIEVLQSTGDGGRSAEWWDIGANILGIGCGAVLSLLLIRKVQAFNWGD